MKNLVSVLLLTGVVLRGIRSIFSQTLVRAQSVHQKETPAKSLPKKQFRKLQEHYAINILFFDRTVEGLLVAGDAINFNAPIETNLTAILKPLGSRFKKENNVAKPSRPVISLG